MDQAPLPPRVRRCALVALTLLSGLIYGYGLRGNLPYFEGTDEQFSVGVALDMVTRGSWNPRWFGNPGSTLIYPLSTCFSWWYAVTGDGALMYRNPELPELLADGGGAEFYLLGRWIQLLYAMTLVPLTFAVGRRAFGERTALLGALLLLPCPVLVAHAKVVRTDVAGVVFALIALHAQLRLLDEGDSRRRWIWAGVAVGLATGTRYLLLALAPGLLVAAYLRGLRERRRWLGVALLAIPLGFVICTPYALIDAGTLHANVAKEGRSQHLGADGLGFGGNLQYYLGSMAEQSLPLLVLPGIALALWRRESRGPTLVLGAFVSALTVGMSLLSLHWARWLIPVYPVLALCAALPLVWLAGKWRLAALLALVPLWFGGLGDRVDGVQSIQRRAVAPHTRVLAREWMLQHLPRDARVGQEWYCAALSRTSFQRDEVHHLPERSLDEWRGRVRYLVLSSDMAARYRRQSVKFAAEVAFYDRLARDARLLHRVAPQDGATGPTIEIYELDR